MAAALRQLLRQQAAAPPSPMLRSLFRAPYSKAAAAAAASLPAVHRAPPPPSRLREVTPRKAPPTPKGEPIFGRTVPSTMTDSTKSLPDKLKDLKDSKKSLEDMEKNIEEHDEMIKKALDDHKAANGLFRKRLDDREKLMAKIENTQYGYGTVRNMQDDLAKVRNMRVAYDKDWAIHEAKGRLVHEQVGMLSEKRKDYLTALRRHNELGRSTMEHVEKMEKVEKVKKVAKVGAAVGLVGGLLLILSKI